MKMSNIMSVDDELWLHSCTLITFLETGDITDISVLFPSLGRYACAVASLSIQFQFISNSRYMRSGDDFRVEDAAQKCELKRTTEI